MDHVKLGDAHLELDVSGRGEPVVLIHGALIADAFLPLAANTDLARDFRLIVYHRRGYAGSSPLTRTTSLGEQAADCLALLHQLDIHRAHVAGHSLGGAIALQLALDAPAAVGTLVLMEPAMFVGESADPYRESLRQGAALAAQVGAAAAVDGFLGARWTGYREHLDLVLPDGFEQAVRDADGQFAHELPGLLDWVFGEDEARRVDQPTLSVLGGANDLPGTRFQEVHRFLLEELPNAEGVVMAGMEHMMHMQDPPGLAAVLRDFWRRHPLMDQ